MRRKVNLHYQQIRQINLDLITMVAELGTSTVPGAYLIFLYEARHEIPNHGFEEDKFYNIHVKNQYVLISESVQHESTKHSQLF